jgi:Prokaryotic Cytochrome C oxidase subunit IV
VIALTATTIVRTHAGRAWLALMGATLVSWYLGDGHGAPQHATVMVIAVAFAKVYLVGHSFMELRDAAMPLRRVFGGWVLIVGLALIAMYLLTR